MGPFLGPNEGPGIFPEGAGSLYSMDATGSITKKDPGYTIANGLAWSGDNSTFYFVDSTPRQVYAFDYDVATGSLSKCDVLYRFSFIKKIEWGRKA